MAEEPEIHPDLLRLNELVAFCEKRARRAAERLDAAVAESFDARDALETAHRRLAEWIEANPDPQMELI